jgi:uncharacterized membrane protein
MFQLFLFLHILGAIVAYGFGFAVPVIGRMAAAEPQHAPFFLRAGKRVSDTILLPASLSMAVTGVALIATGSRQPKELWLGVAIAIYVVATLVVLFVQRPTFGKLVALTSMPPGPGGPSPEVPQLVARARRVGYGLTAAVVVIVFLMVFKPAF